MEIWETTPADLFPSKTSSLTNKNSLISNQNNQNNLASKSSLNSTRAKSKTIMRSGNSWGYFENIIKKFKGSKQGNERKHLFWIFYDSYL